MTSRAGWSGTAREMLAVESSSSTALAAVTSGRSGKHYDEDEPANALFVRLLLFEARLEKGRLYVDDDHPQGRIHRCRVEE